MFAIVTRNELRSRRYAPAMVWAWSHIRRQLAETPGMLRYTTGIANLREFFTLTLWEREFDMYRFMSSDAHADMMWNFRKWDASFWSMRFNPSGETIGQWSGLDFAGARSDARDTGGTFADEVPEALLRFLPVLRHYRMQPSGCQTLNVDAVIGRVATPSPGAIVRLKRAVGRWRNADDMCRFAVCVGPWECLLIGVWQRPSAEATRAFLHRLHERFPQAWAMRCHVTDFEVGHWHRLRLRELAAVQ